jgi:hypothetical protein
MRVISGCTDFGRAKLLVGAALLFLPIPALAQGTDIALNTPANGQIGTATDIKQYRLQLTDSGPLFVHLDKTKGVIV